MTEPRTLIVGCPVSLRHWILPTWRRYLDAELARTPAVRCVGLQFVGSPSDRRTLDIITRWPDAHVVTTGEPARTADVRDWQANPNRYAVMAQIRNTLLGEVRRRNPDLFLSLDSDMLLATGALAGMLELYDADPACWAVGGKAYMVGDGESRNEPSFAMANRSSITRTDFDGTGRVDVIMGIKLMDRRAYHVDYRFHRTGEDIGWSAAIKDAGGILRWDGRTTSKHVMELPWLHLIDPRVGY